MKKLFSLTFMLVACLAMNATDYYLAGNVNSWSNNNANYKFTETNGELILQVADLYGGFKITEDGNWHPQHGAAADGEGVLLGGSYNLVKCDDSQGEADAPADCNILFSENNYEEPRYSNATLKLDASNPNALVITLVSGTLYDHAVLPATYQIVGGFTGNWSTDDAIQFEPVNGVLTANVPDLNGGFKIIQDREWTNQWATNWENGGGLQMNVPYTMGGKIGKDEPTNLGLANPFGSYENAVLTLTKSGDDMILTLVGGTFKQMQADWYIPGSWQGKDWLCNEAAKMSPVAGQANTYELLLAEFSGEFKVVYGIWAVEFGSAKNAAETWTLNQTKALSSPCDNLLPASEETYTDVTIRIVVDYENVSVNLQITSENNPSAIEDVMVNQKAVKRIINGEVVIEHDGVRYNILGTIK